MFIYLVLVEKKFAPHGKKKKDAGHKIAWINKSAEKTMKKLDKGFNNFFPQPDHKGILKTEIEQAGRYWSNDIVRRCFSSTAFKFVRHSN